MRELAQRAGVSLATLHSIESGDAASLESYARVGAALGLRPTLEFADARQRGRTTAIEASEDFVHSAMGEFEARALAGSGVRVSIDEPYQHYQFAGRADVLAWDDENLLHIENRTRFPNLQEAAGSYNAKRQYLAPSIAQRLNLGPRGWRSVTHVMACLWSSEVIHALRLRRATFEALCPGSVGRLSRLARRHSTPVGRHERRRAARSSGAARITSADDRGFLGAGPSRPAASRVCRCCRCASSRGLGPVDAPLQASLTPVEWVRR